MTEKRPGRWKTGQSGNPRGRTPGTGHIAQLRRAIDNHVPDIIAKLAESALAGDVAASRLLLERVIPPIKASEEAAVLELPDGTLTDQGRAVLAAVGSGVLAPGQGAAVLQSLGALAKLVETDELAARIAALEAANATRS